MSANNQEIETIVRMVFDRLRDSGLADGTLRGGSLESAYTATASKDSPESLATHVSLGTKSDTLAVVEPVVTLNTIEGRLGGIKRLLVTSQSVVTPAVRDELRRKGIALVRGDSGTTQASSRTASVNQLSKWIIIAPEKHLSVVSSINRALQIVPFSSVDEPVVRNTLLGMGDSDRAVWCSSRPFAAIVACGSLNRTLRSVLLHDSHELRRAVQEAAPQVVVVDDRRWSGFQVARLVQAWSQFNFGGGQ